MAALDYPGSAALMISQPFIDRIKVACLSYAVYILNEAGSVAAHADRLKWAQTVIDNAAGVAQSIVPTVVMDPGVQANGSAITDTALQASVQATVDKIGYC